MGAPHRDTRWACVVRLELIPPHTLWDWGFPSWKQRQRGEDRQADPAREGQGDTERVASGTIGRTEAEWTGGGGLQGEW